jgi:hypothetical protein
MATGPTKTADEFADSVRSLVDRMVDARITKELTQRGQEAAALLVERGSELGDRAADVWKDTKPMRRDAAKSMRRAQRDAAKWSDQTWRTSLRPAIRDLWKRRTVALGAAGAAVPAGRELVTGAVERLGIKQREERHWGAFFLGMILGAAAGAIIAMLTAPKPGKEMRRELTSKASEVRDEIAARAREAEWVPLFERPGEVTSGNGHGAATSDDTEPIEAASIVAEPIASEPIDTEPVIEGASEAGATAVERADEAADETAEAINDAFESGEGRPA